MITVKDIEKAGKVAKKAESLKGTEDIRYYKDTVDKLIRFTNGLEIAGIIIIIFLIIISIVVVSNTIKLTVQSRSEEISIMKYVGATNAFIRTPFFVEGMVTGFFAGAGAFFITWAVYRSVFRILMEQGTLMRAFGVGSIIPFNKIQLWVALAYLVIGALVGALGSVVSTRRHIDV